MNTNFINLAEVEQGHVNANPAQDALRVCHVCGSTDMENSFRTDEWGYKLYYCRRCRAMCEYWY